MQVNNYIKSSVICLILILIEIPSVSLSAESPGCIKNKNIEWFNKINKHFKIGIDKKKVAITVLREILPGEWQISIHKCIFIDSNLYYKIINYQYNQSGEIEESGRIEVVENGIKICDEISYIESCELYKSVKIPGSCFFRIIFTKYACWGENCIQANFRFK